MDIRARGAAACRRGGRGAGNSLLLLSFPGERRKAGGNCWKGYLQGGPDPTSQPGIQTGILLLQSELLNKYRLFFHIKGSRLDKPHIINAL